jgi:hypothetical protein
MQTLMHNRIRSVSSLHLVPHDEATVHAAVMVVTTTKHNIDTQVQISSVHNDVPFGEALQHHVVQLGSTRLWFVYWKRMEKSYVCPILNRLLISWKHELHHE